MDMTLRLRLSVMMLLQYAVWGAWAVPLASYLLATPESGGLGFSGAQTGWTYTSTAIAAIVSPFFLGMVADRYFSTERCLAVLHLLGAGLLFLAAQTGIGQFWYLFHFMVIYALCYMPTIALTNSLCFRNMDRPDLLFPGIRVFGTIGWIIIGLTIGLFFQEVSNQPLLFASGLSVILGIYCFTLPHTPPMASNSSVDIGAKALVMLKNPSFAVFIVVSFLISILLAFYYQLANPFLRDIQAPNPQALQTIGQFSEMLLLPFLPIFIRLLGIKWTIAIGMMAWCVRYGVFATESIWPVILIGLPLHGICFDFFFVTSQIYVDEEAPSDIRASAQGFLAFVMLGVGMFLGNVLAGNIKDWATVEMVTNWTRLWIVPCFGALVSIVIFLIFFREPARKNGTSGKG